ncbi:hypothetical protein B0T12DRAFT_397516 [Alternaria alternata]|nr:hypothetical protein B0T12DRAFT_397516 [Alternaria alternata]
MHHRTGKLAIHKDNKPTNVTEYPTKAVARNHDDDSAACVTLDLQSQHAKACDREDSSKKSMFGHGTKLESLQVPRHGACTAATSWRKQSKVLQDPPRNSLNAAADVCRITRSLHEIKKTAEIVVTTRLPFPKPPSSPGITYPMHRRRESLLMSLGTTPQPDTP